MSIESEFNSTIENIKSDYEGLENIGADLTNIDKNIYNIRTCLDNIYDNLPKTTGEGSNLSLTTLKGRINVDDILGDTTQEGTPTPSSPQDIEVVTGTQEVVVANSDNTETQTKTLHLGDIELAKIGTYQDRIYKNSDKWYIEKNIGKVLLKDVPQGANNWTKSNAYSTNDYFCGFCGFATSIKTNSYYILCNKLVNALYTDATTNECIANNSETINLKIKASRLSENSPTGLANYLANEGSDIYILYILKTPTYTEITNETLLNELNELEKMYSYNGQTNISVSGNLPMILDVTALKGE